MASPSSNIKKLQARWDELKLKISSERLTESNESEQTREARKARARADYGFLVTYYFPHYAKDKAGNITPSAPFQIKAADEVKNDPMYKGIWEWFRGSAKSVNADVILPIYLMIQEVRQVNTMMLIGSNNTTATRLLQDIQAELEVNPRLINDFGPFVKDGSWEQGEFVTLQGVAFVALGMGEKPRGTRFGNSRPDLIICDDLDDDKMKKSPSRVRESVDWLYRAVLGTGDTGISRFLLVNNRIAKNGILATLVAERPHWYHSKVNALDENGVPSWNRYTREFYDALRKDVGWKAFETEWQNDPQEDAGVFELEDIKWEKLPKDWTDFDAIVMYGDPSFSTGKKSDFFSIPAWAKWGNRLAKLKVYHRQGETAGKAIDWWFNFYVSLPPQLRVKFRCYIEANATQKLLLKPEIDKAAKKYGIVNFIKYDTEKKGDKNDRIGSMTTTYENGDVVYNIDEKDDPDMIASVEQLTAWEEGAAHDDGPDADQSAWAKLEKLKRISGRTTQRTGTFAKNNSRSF